MNAIHQIRFAKEGVLHIDLPKEFVNRSVEVIVLLKELNEALPSLNPTKVKRSPPKHLIGVGSTLGDLTQPLADENTWECLE